MNMYQIVKTDGNTKEVVTGALSYHEAIAKINELNRYEQMAHVIYSMELYMPIRRSK